METHDPSRNHEGDTSLNEQETIDRLKRTDIYYSIFAQSPASIGLVTADTWEFIDVNNGFERIFGYGRAEVIGRTVDELDIIVDSELGNILRSLEEEPIIQWTESKIRTKEGEIRDALGSYMRVEIQDEKYVVLKLIDISNLRQLEREVLEASDRERRRIGQDLHDDLGQWLDGVTMLARSLQQDLEDEAPEKADQAEQIANSVVEATDRARRLARGLAPAALADQGLVSALEEYAAHIEEAHGISCVVEYEEPIALGDTSAEQLYRLLQEGVHNAAQHSEADTITIRLRQDERGLTAEVIDGGIGISEEVLEENDGLGLHTMDYRARMMGGWLNIEGEEDEGTIVRCRIPGMS